MNLKFLSSEKFFIISIASLAMLFNLLPYIYQYKIAPPDKVYVGSYPIIYDKPTYLAEMVQGKEGNWKMINMYTTEPQKPVFLYPLYLGMGHIAGISGISVENIFLIARFFFGIILLGVVLYFIHYFVPDANQRKVAYFLALFASGAGWIFQHIQSLDLGYVIDTIPQIRFSYFPHFSVSHILFLGTIMIFYHSLNAKNGRFFVILAGIASFILNLVLPFTGILLYFLILSLLIIFFINKKSALNNNPQTAKENLSFWKHNNFKNILIFFALSLPSLFFMYYIGTTDPIWKIVEEQNILPTPPLEGIISGFGLPLLFSAIGIKTLIEKKHTGGLFFFVWIFGAIALAFIPTWIYPMQRRFLETALYVPIAITASFGIKEIYNYYNKKNKYRRFNLAYIFIAGIIVTPIMFGSIFFSQIIFYSSLNKTNEENLYLSAENVEAMIWLKNNTPKNSIILSSFKNGNNIPYFSNRMVYLGHSPMTINVNEKLKIAENFYTGKYSSGEMIDFLKKERISYVFYSETEKKSEEGEDLGTLDIENYTFLENVYQNKNAYIYKFE